MKRTNKILTSLASIVALFSVFAIFASAQEIQFVEQFAIASDREAVLEQLIPGTADYYYFHCLHYQNTGRLDEVDKLLEPWTERHPNSAEVRLIKNRQALLRYDSDSKATLEYLKSELKLDYAHQREIPEADKKLPTELDPESYDVEKLISYNILQRENTDLFEDAALPLLASRTETHTRLKHLLTRVQWPDFPNLVDLIVEELSHKESSGFGSIPIHSRLTLEQMQELQTKTTKLKNDTRFVDVYLKKLGLSGDGDMSNSPELKAEYLQRLWEYVDTLHPAHNSLKACVRYHQLRVDQKLGTYDRKKFMSYIQLPRQMGYVNEDFLKRIESPVHKASLDFNFQKQIGFTPVGNDQQLVADYLQQLLKKPADLKAFGPFIKSEFLETQWATANILKGTGDGEQWASMLSPEQYKQLVERVDLEFTATNQTVFKASDVVELKLHTKNIDKLIVKIFEINSENYYRRFGREIDTKINLDGLIPNETLTFEYEEPAAKRVERSFEFEKLKERGVYVIDFIGNGKSSRAIVHKGQFSFLKRIAVAGHEFTIIDEEGKPVNGAELLIGGRLFSAVKDAKDKPTNNIIVPFSHQEVSEVVIIRKGDFCTLDNFKQVIETYELNAGLHVDRESLLRARKSKVVVRPQLRLANTPVPVELLENVRLQITTTDLDGDSATITKTDIELSEKGESVLEFQVPPRLSKVAFKLTGEIKSLSTSKRIDTVATRTVTINQIDQTDDIQDVHLLRSESKYLLEVRGISGENRPNQAVTVSLKTRILKQPITVSLQSDEDGVVQLGELAGIESIIAQCTSGSGRKWNLEPDGQVKFSSINAAVGDTVMVAAPPELRAADRAQIGLFELVDGGIVRDWFDSIAAKDGLVAISDLKAGDYKLIFKDSGRVTLIRVTQGELVGTRILGKNRHFEARPTTPLHIQKLTGKKQLNIKLGGTTPETRVHVYATRYQPRFNPLAEFGNVRDIEPAVIYPSMRRSKFMAGRQIGSEYQYILDRRYATKFAGNMLERPPLLLNPFSIGNANNRQETLLADEDFDGSSEPERANTLRSKGETGGADKTFDFANLDYLKNESLLLANLKPNAKGVVSIDPKKLGDKQHLVIVAVDMFSTVQRSFAFPAVNPETRDLRLAGGFDPDANVSQSKQTEILQPNKEFIINDVSVAQFQSFDDLGDIYLVLQALNPDPHWAKFNFVLEWPNKTQEEKQSLYSEFACHELNFFLYKKDEPFFLSVVKPYIKNKREKTFLDHYLLGNDLNEYLEPSAFASLNSTERVLLSQKLENRRNDIRQHLTELYQLRPTTRDYAGKLYDSTVAAGTIIAGNSSIDKEVQERLKGLDGTLPQLSTGWVEQRTRTVTTMSTQTRTRMVPVQRTRAESRTRTVMLEDGSQVTQNYTVNVPYTEQVAQNYTVQVPVQSEQNYTVPMFAANQVQAPQFDFRQQNYSVRNRQANGQSVNGVAGQMLPIYDADPLVIGGGVVIGGGEWEEEKFNIAKDKDFGKSRASEFYETDQNGDGESGKDFGISGKRYQEAERLYRRLALTQELIEQHYYRKQPADQNFLAVPMNRFWRDYANHDDGPFISQYFAEAHSSFTEMMFVLSVTDLPFTAAQHKIDYVENEMRLTPGSPMIAMHQQMRSAIVDQKNTTVLVSENFFNKNDRYRFENETRFDKFVSDRFSANTLYGGQVVLTNPTSSPRSVELLIQIPRGSVAVAKSKDTQTIDVSLDAFSTKSFEYSFYFPTAGEFTHFPAHVASDRKVIAIAKSTAFVVDDKPAKVDKSSWRYVSQNGTNNEVIKFLKNENVLRLKLEKIAFRMKDAKFFKRVTDVLRNRYRFDSTLWSYSIMHDDVQTINEFLTQNPFAALCGIRLESTPLTIQPVKRNWYQHRDYSPLVNARAHQVGRNRTILNLKIHQQYHKLMSIFAHQPELNSEERMALTYYLLLQDRIEEAIEQFDAVKKTEIAEQVQYDYCDAYIKMYLEKPDEAEAIAKVHAEHPVDRWRTRFQTVLAHIEEIRGGEPTAVDPDDRTESQTEMASKAASFDFSVESNTVNITYQNVDQLVVNYYQMDAELLFSRNPFGQSLGDGFSLIRPNDSQAVELDDSGKAALEIPESMLNKNVTIEVTSGEQTESKAHFAHSMSIQLIKNFGQLKITHKETGEALPKTYIKVYAQYADGGVTFFKDGYTDLRGRFDYVTQSNSNRNDITRLAVLVMNEEHGTTVRLTTPPQE